WIGRGLPLHVRAIPPKPHVFDLAAVKAWLAAEGLQQDVDLSAPKNRAEADLALVLQKIRAARAGADKAELGLKVRKGELLEAAEVERGRIERITAVTSALEAMPGKLAPELVGRDARAIQARIAEEVTRIREDFAK
ncbi:MAG TPA: hypothetical protein VEA38_12180, partial [Terriglobales bacterium]|nr:hypothetical protein [Terriglobales bacterium]